jgi:putative FmdB family regulatory protein
MPIYEYRCGHCGVFEEMQKISEAPLKRCPKCKGKVEKMVSRTSFVLKGSGWYATDYARKPATGSDSSSSSSDSGTSGSTSGNGTSSSDSKSDSSAKADSSSKSDSGSKADTSTAKSSSSKSSTSKSTD